MGPPFEQQHGNARHEDRGGDHQSGKEEATLQGDRFPFKDGAVKPGGTDTRSIYRAARWGRRGGCGKIARESKGMSLFPA
ncbi:hypothetical protein FRZ44_14200 [Hypericibacter terrae]|uniref:Uncharacterized protein n=1 Tax=Hypericibacter terrae TaxID=2602015 RepID=A0A5J6MFB1_9PROT|nr:hypothetical protein FRZ44_14200 [Hypericibacter terrae]